MGKIRAIIVVIVMGLALLLAGCGGAGKPDAQNTESDRKELLLATTTSTYDSGLLHAILPFFEEEHNYKVNVISLGTGAALGLGASGDCDLVLVHDRETELQMVSEGHYVDRRDVMYNDFLLVGPKHDPAGVLTVNTLAEALRAIAKQDVPFLSRGDNSGTHKKEQQLWDGAQVSAGGKWYVVVGSGMGETLRMTDEMEGYTLTDRATYLSLKHTLDLVTVFEGGEQLLNPYGIMAVDPANFPQRDYEGAKLLIDYFTSSDGQERIKNFQPNGETLFFPNAD